MTLMTTPMEPNSSAQTRPLAEVAEARGLNVEQIVALAQAAPPLWPNVTPEAQIDDLALLLRALTPGEIRVRVQAPNEQEAEWEVTVVAADRLGLLAITTSVLASFDLTITRARVGTWLGATALQHLWVRPHTKSSVEPPWATIGQSLRHALDSVADTSFSASSIAAQWVRSVELLDEQLEPGAAPGLERYVVVVETTDIPGVLAAISSRFGSLQLNVISAEITTVGGLVKDRFIVEVPIELNHRVAQLKS
jgi:UTP:GlnB (protein PII) uridylyltransferase